MWNNTMTTEPWLFRYQALIMEEDDEFQNRRTVVLDKVDVWACVLKLPGNYLHAPVIKGMCLNMEKNSRGADQVAERFCGSFCESQSEG